VERLQSERIEPGMRIDVEASVGEVVHSDEHGCDFFVVSLTSAGNTWTIRRRYSAFLALKRNIERCQSYLVLHDILKCFPPKHIVMSGDKLLKRQHLLDCFLTRLVASECDAEVIRQIRIFLGTDNSDSFAPRLTDSPAGPLACRSRRLRSRRRRRSADVNAAVTQDNANNAKRFLCAAVMERSLMSESSTNESPVPSHAEARNVEALSAWDKIGMATTEKVHAYTSSGAGWTAGCFPIEQADAPGASSSCKTRQCSTPRSNAAQHVAPQHNTLHCSTARCNEV
jgi:hypothetical protein